MEINVLFVLAGILGGAVYGFLGYLRVRKTNEDFDVSKFLDPCVAGGLLGGVAVVYSPELGLGEVATCAEAGLVGYGGSSVVKQLLNLKDGVTSGGVITALINKYFVKKK